MIIGIDHGYYAIKTKQVCFPTGSSGMSMNPIPCRISSSTGENIMCVGLGDRHW